MIDFAQLKRIKQARFKETRDQKISMWGISALLALIYVGIMWLLLPHEFNPWYAPLLIPILLLLVASVDVIDKHEAWLPMRFHLTTLMANIIAALGAMLWYVFPH